MRRSTPVPGPVATSASTSMPSARGEVMTPQSTEERYVTGLRVPRRAMYWPMSTHGVRWPGATQFSGATFSSAFSPFRPT